MHLEIHVIAAHKTCAILVDSCLMDVVMDVVLSVATAANVLTFD